MIASMSTKIHFFNIKKVRKEILEYIPLSINLDIPIEIQTFIHADFYSQEETDRIIQEYRK